MPEDAPTQGDVTTQGTVCNDVMQGEDCNEDWPERLTAPQQRQLCQAARAAAARSYSPYSRFRVGAAVLTAGGLFTGTNVENASFGLTLCAERTALATAIAAGERDIRAVAIACIDAEAKAGLPALMPCGACRQWLVELAPMAEIFICSGPERCNADEPQVFTVAELLPQAFRL